jgi:hypothetical protein
MRLWRLQVQPCVLLGSMGIGHAGYWLLDVWSFAVSSGRITPLSVDTLPYVSYNTHILKQKRNTMTHQWAVVKQETMIDEHVITLVSVFESDAEASAEADRLNDNNAFVEDFYFVRSAVDDVLF